MNKGMKKHVMRAAACFVTGSMLAGSSSMAAFAAGTVSAAAAALLVRPPQGADRQGDDARQHQEYKDISNGGHRDALLF